MSEQPTTVDRIVELISLALAFKLVAMVITAIGRMIIGK